MFIICVCMTAQVSFKKSLECVCVWILGRVLLSCATIIYLKPITIFRLYAKNLFNYFSSKLSRCIHTCIWYILKRVFQYDDYGTKVLIIYIHKENKSREPKCNSKKNWMQRVIVANSDEWPIFNEFCLIAEKESKTNFYYY